MKTVKQIREEARRLHSCELFRGTESEAELARLFLSPQGQEFCINNNFPDVQTFADAFPHATEHGIYIDAGNVELCNEAVTALIGDTHAVLHYSDPSKRHEVILMHGATADITAEGYAVVFVTAGKGCKVTKTAKEKAIIMHN